MSRFKASSLSHDWPSTSIERLEPRNLLAGDLAGLYGDSAEMIFDGNTEAVRPGIASGTQIGEHFYLLAHDRIGDYEVWQTDGTQEGTERYAEVGANLPTDGNFWRCCNIGSAGGQLYFVIDRNRPEFKPGLFHWWLGQSELWTSDGTESGTVPLAGMAQAFAEARLHSQFLDHDGRLLMTTRWSSFGIDQQIWISDGTEGGTSSFHRAGANFFNPIQDLVLFNGKYYFLGLNFDTARPTPEIFGLWEAKPDAGEIQLVKEFSGYDVDSAGPTHLAVSHGLMFFAADEGSGQELFRSDGTSDGTVQVKDINVTLGDARIRAFTETFEGTLFVADDGTGERVWITDGTETGTQLYDGEQDYQVTRLSEWDGSSIRTVLRTAPTSYETDQLRLFYQSSELWAAHRDGGEAKLLGADLSVVGLFDEKPVITDGETVFVLEPADLSLEPRFELPTTTLGSDPVALATVNKQLFYVSEKDGSAFLLEDRASDADSLPDVGLVVYDGSDDLLTDAVEFKGELYVFGQTGLMKWDSVELAWTLLIPNDDTFSRFGDTIEESRSRVTILGGGDGVYYILRKRDSSGASIWKTDGTLDGTAKVGAVGIADFDNLTEFVYHDGDLFFQRRYCDIEAESHFFELRRFSVSTATDELVAPLARSVSAFASGNGWLYMADSVGGLWRTDGQSFDFQLVKQFEVSDACCDFEPMIGNLTPAGEELFFTVDDGIHGNELWVTDGSPEGTQLAVDLRDGRNSSDPSELTVWGDELAFVANDGQHGRELWKISLAVDDVMGDVNGNGIVEFDDFLLLSANFGTNVENGVADGDFDENGVVDMADFDLLSQNFGKFNS